MFVVTGRHVDPMCRGPDKALSSNAELTSLTPSYLSPPATLLPASILPSHPEKKIK